MYVCLSDFFIGGHGSPFYFFSAGLSALDREQGRRGNDCEDFGCGGSKPQAGHGRSRVAPRCALGAGDGFKRDSTTEFADWWSRLPGVSLELFPETSLARCGCRRPRWTQKCFLNCCSLICKHICRERHREDSSVGKSGASAGAAEWIVSADFSRARKTGADLGAHCRHRWRGKSRVSGTTGYTSRSRLIGTRSWL